MEEQRHSITKAGLQKMKDKKALLQEKIEQILARIEENSAGESRFEDVECLHLIEQKIRLEEEAGQLGRIIDSARVIRKGRKKSVVLGCEIKLENHTVCHRFKLVDPLEANSMEGKISNESPLGSSLVGKAVGDCIMIPTPEGRISFNIVSIS